MTDSINVFTNSESNEKLENVYVKQVTARNLQYREWHQEGLENNVYLYSLDSWHPLVTMTKDMTQLLANINTVSHKH